MSNIEEPKAVNGHSQDREPEASQGLLTADSDQGSVPPSPDLRKREVSQAPSSPNLRRREVSQVPPSPNLRKRTNTPFVVSPTATASKSTPQKTFEEFVNEDKTKESQLTNPINVSSPVKIEVKNQKNVWDIVVQWKWSTAIGLLVVLIVLAVVYSIQTKTDVTGDEIKTVRTWKASRNFLLNKIRSLKKEFRAQKEETWIQVLAAVNSTLSDHEPKQPSSIVLLVPPEVPRDFFTCFTQLLAEAVKDAHIPRNINKQQEWKTQSAIKEMDPEYFTLSDSVTRIHEDLKKYLHQDKTVIFYDVDKIQREEHLMVFHGFCDSSQAFDKRATYFFVIPVPQDVLGEFAWIHRNGEEMAQHILNTAWVDALSEDKRPAVISRILANIVLINGGDSCSK